LPNEVKEEIKEIVTDAIEDAGKSGWPICALEAQKVNQLESMAIANRKLLTGNGDPEHGLVMKVDRLVQDVKMIKTGIWFLASSAMVWVLYSIFSHVLTQQ